MAPKPLIRKSVKWRVSEKLQGDAQTESDGQVHIYFSTENNENFSEIMIVTSKKSYTIGLVSDLVLELDDSECL